MPRLVSTLIVVNVEVAGIVVRVDGEQRDAVRAQLRFGLRERARAPSVTYLRNVLESCEDRTGGREDVPNACLDVCFINTLPVAAAPWWVASCPRRRESSRRAPWGLDARLRGHDILLVMTLVPDLRNGHLGCP